MAPAALLGGKDAGESSATNLHTVLRLHPLCVCVLLKYLVHVSWYPHGIIYWGCVNHPSCSSCCCSISCSCCCCCRPSETQKTSVKINDNSPRWSETFDFVMISAGSILTVNVLNKVGVMDVVTSLKFSKVRRGGGCSCG